MENIKTEKQKNRRTNKIIIGFLVFLFFCFSVKCCFAQQKDQWIQTAIQMSTTVSDGSLTSEEVIDVARLKGFKAVIITDRDFRKWEYGLWPLRQVIKRTIEEGSIFKYGVDKYLKHIELISSKNKDIVIIPGIEVAPYYHWTGSMLSGNLKISDWHKHILVAGLKDINDFKNLPVLSSRWALRKPYGFRDIVLLWPFLVFALGLYFLRRREQSYVDDAGRELGPYSKKWIFGGVILIFLSVLFSINNWPFRVLEYDQYENVSPAKPYQILIDYVRKHGGVTFWAHPEAENIDKLYNVIIETNEHVANLWENIDYTGFAIFYEGYKIVGKIGGEWDNLLKAYCEGRRNSPLWIISGLAFDKGTRENLMSLMDDLQTYVLTPLFTQDAIVESMKKGRMVVSSGVTKNKLFLEKFVIRDSVSGKTAVMGETISCKGRPVLEIKGRFAQQGLLETTAIEIKVIKDGNILKVLNPLITTGLDVAYEDNEPIDKKTFYRLEIINNGQRILTNPVFVENR